MDMMDQETAQKLFLQGATFTFLGVPEETQFGIDMQCWNTDEDFRGIKMIPPGVHYIHYSAVSRSTGDIAPRSGFFLFLKKKDFIVKMWDKKTEDISLLEISEESIQRLKDNLLNLDKFLAPYPYEIWKKWTLLSSHITEELVAKLTPECGIIRSSLDLLSCTDENRPRSKKTTVNKMITEKEVPSSNTEEISIDKAGTSEINSSKLKFRLTKEEKEEALLPELKPAPGTSIRFTKISREKWPAGSTPQEITKHHLDQSYTLELMMAQHEEPLHIIGELEFSYICFLIGSSLDAFEHWKNLVVLLCSCEDAVHKNRNLYFNFLKVLEVQIEEIPQEFLADIVMNKNIIYKKLRDFFKTAYASNFDSRILTSIQRLKTKLSDTFMWDFTELDEEDEDERPVIVTLKD